MRILGVGIDLSMIDSFAEICRKREKYIDQFCTGDELKFVRESPTPFLDANKIFSIKEAVGKAFGTGLVDEIWFDDIQIRLATRAPPAVELSQQALSLATARLSTSQFNLAVDVRSTNEFVNSVCIIRGEPNF